MAEAALQDDMPRNVDEFERWHANQPDPWEFIGGRPCLMAPGSMPHTIIKGNVFANLRAALRGTPCHVFTDGVQIRTDEISAIPDAVVTCAPLDRSTPIVAEPTIVVEVMSPWSETDDTQRKWFSYRKISSLRHYLVVAQDRREVLVHSRAGDLWRERFVTEGGIELDDPPLTLDLDDLYENIDLAG
jgi:Uma2 family endonuclease